jgi:hypothetical protein
VNCRKEMILKEAMVDNLDLLAQNADGETEKNHIKSLTIDRLSELFLLQHKLKPYTYTNLLVVTLNLVHVCCSSDKEDTKFSLSITIVFIFLLKSFHHSESYRHSVVIVLWHRGNFVIFCYVRTGR